MSSILRLSSSTPATLDVLPPSTLPALLAPREQGSDGGLDASPVDGGRTLRLIERAASSMQQMEQQLETISMRGRDLLRLSRDERKRYEVELQAARTEAETWKIQAIAAEAGLRDATLKAWEADLHRRECEAELQEARQRADAADQRTRDVEDYLRRIDAALRSRFSMIPDLGRPSGDLAIP